MKQRYTLTLSLLVALGAHAQISIGPNEMPHANDALARVQAATNLQINYAATGPAHTWNFPNLVANQGDVTNYQTVASTNFVYAIVYADIFLNTNRANHAKPGTDIPFSAILPINNAYTFRYRSNSTYKTVGYGAEVSGIPLPITFDQHDVIYQLPLNYGNTSTSNSSYTIDIPSVGTYGFKQVRTNVVDGWGAITTPGGVFDVLRVKTTLTMRDSVFGVAVNRPVAREYKWLAQGLRVPVLQINTTTIFGQEVVSAIYYYDVPRSIDVVTPLATSLCPGATLQVHYETTGAFYVGGFFVAGNHFTAQLSDATGSFATPVVIGDVTATGSGTISATIPANTPPGTGYRIRVVSTSPTFTGASVPFDISIGSATVAAISAVGSTMICTGDALTLTAVGGPGYQWQLDGADIGGATSETYDATGAGDYTVVVDNTCGMATSNTITVQLNTPPMYTVDQASYLVCAGTSIAIVAHDQDGQSPVSYQWMLNDAPIPGATDSVVMASLGGLYTLEVINGTTGCSFITPEVTVVVETEPAPMLSAMGTTTFCAGGSVTLAVAATAGSSYQWYLDGLDIAGAMDLDLVASGSGAYTVVATSANGCASTASSAVTVTANPVPVAPNVTATDPTTFCVGAGTTLVADAINNVAYQWYQDAVELIGANAADLPVSTSGAYTVSVTDVNGCSATSDAVTVQVNTPPVYTVDQTSYMICDGTSATITAHDQDGQSPLSYQWMLDGAPLPGATDSVVMASLGGAYTLEVTNVNTGCSFTTPAVTVDVETVATPVLSATGITTFCAGGSVTLAFAGTAGNSYQWYLDGVAITGAVDTALVASGSGAYTVVATSTSGCASTASALVDVTANPLPVAPNVTATGGTAFCVGAGTTLIADAINNVVYQWYQDAVELVGANGTELPVTTPGAYTVSVTDVNGCSATSDAITVQVNTAPVYTVDQTSYMICDGTSATITAHDQDGQSPLSYQWMLDGAPLPGATDSVVMASLGGAYTLEVTNVNTGCSFTTPAVTVDVETVAIPMVSASGTTTFCAGGSVTLAFDATAGNSYQWYLDGQAIAGAVDTALVASGSGGYTVVATSTSGCASTASTVVVVTANPVPVAPNVSATGPTTFCADAGTTLVAETIVDVTYQWYLDAVALGGANGTDLLVTTSGAYTVSVTDVNGCSATSTAIDMVVNPLPPVPVITDIMDSLFVTDAGTYQWYLDGVAITGATEAWLLPVVTGSYTVVVTDANGCSNTSDPFVWVNTGIATRNTIDTRLMPNPSNGSFAIQVGHAHGQAFEILDATGRRVRTGRLTNTRTMIEMTDAQAGLYFLRFVGEEATPVLRFIITR